eukprot:1596484-Prymnesium_polylepis.2
MRGKPSTAASSTTSAADRYCVRAAPSPSSATATTGAPAGKGASSALPPLRLPLMTSHRCLMACSLRRPRNRSAIDAHAGPVIGCPATATSAIASFSCTSSSIVHGCTGPRDS